MAQYRKKPVVIEAVQFLGVKSFYEMVELWGQSFVNVCGFFAGSVDDKMDMNIKTLEGTMKVFIGDWVIRGIKGEFYPCKNKIFEGTYEKV